jgi:high-affinity K+ transport system ATPase subunit B
MAILATKATPDEEVGLLASAVQGGEEGRRGRSVAAATVAAVLVVVLVGCSVSLYAYEGRGSALEDALRAKNQTMVAKQVRHGVHCDVTPESADSSFATVTHLLESFVVSLEVQRWSVGRLGSSVC